MTRLSARLRGAVVSRAEGRCEYCRTQQVIVIAMEIDHIVPQSVGGLTSLDNLCLACPTCNDFKHDYQTGIDPETQQEVALFNPRTQQWADHFAWDNDFTVLVGLTPTGRATVNRLHMNDPIVVSARRVWVAAGWHPPED